MVTEKDPEAPTADEMIAELENAKQLVANASNPAPWPIVPECHTGRTPCPQCDGSHDHVWVAWHNPDPTVLGYAGLAIPVRCTTCGARKCDTPACRLRRHHGEPHDLY